MTSVAHTIEMAVVILLPNSLIWAKNRFVKNGTANFGRNIPTEICGLCTTSRGAPEYSGQKKPKRTCQS